jgi:molybdenum cofactor biosynthesis enzyme MoaA
MKFYKIQSIRIETSDYCNLKCPSCLRYSNNKNYKVKELNPIESVNKNHISIQQIKKWFPREFLAKRVNGIVLCGQAGEPVLAPDFHEIVKYFISCNCFITVSTNGSVHEKEWWAELAKISRKNVVIKFCPDSIKPNNNLYRINSDTNKVIENMKTYNENGGLSQYSWYIFKHNEDELLEHKRISEEIGCASFVAEFPNGLERIDYYTVDDGKRNYRIEPSTTFSDRNTFPEQGKIFCKAKHRKMLEVSANGILYPCCFLASEFRKAYNNFFINENDTSVSGNIDRYHFVRDIENQGGIKTLSLKHYTIYEILDTPLYQKVIENTWNNDGICKKFCTSADQRISQNINGINIMRSY